MTCTASTTYGADFSEDKQREGALAYLGGSDHYTDAVAVAMVTALMDAHRTEVNNLLPEGVSWTPDSAAFEHPLGGWQPIAHDDMTRLFEEAWMIVDNRLGEIELAVVLALEASDRG